MEVSSGNRSDDFRLSAFNLLSIDDRDSAILGRAELISQLKKTSKVSHADLPRDIDFVIKNRVLKVHIKTLLQNMQVNSAAFEGWILALKTWIPEQIEYVVLDFEIPDHLTEKYGNSETCHYNRFLYRLNNMIRLFPNWFFLPPNKMDIVQEFMHWISSNTCLLNHSLRERQSAIHTDKMERQIESWFTFHEGKQMLCSRWEIDQDKLYNQLPIGVFYREIASKNAIFTRGASAIDLWGIGTDGQTLHLIELKCGRNMGLGVISEILFYAAVIYDSCIADDQLFSFGKYGNASDRSDTYALKNNGVNFCHLFAHILAEKYHPLFSAEVEDMIRAGLANLKIDFDRASYDYTRKVMVEKVPVCI